MNKQLNHHKADIWACQSSQVELWCTFGAECLEGKQKSPTNPKTTRVLLLLWDDCEMLQRQQCNNELAQRSTNSRMSHWELICLWRLLELHLQRLYQRQTHTPPAAVPVGETCLFASSKCLIAFSALFQWKGLLGNEYNIWSGVKPRNLHNICKNTREAVWKHL